MQGERRRGRVRGSVLSEVIEVRDDFERPEIVSRGPYRRVWGAVCL